MRHTECLLYDEYIAHVHPAVFTKMTLKWLTKEWEGFQIDPVENIFARPLDNNLLHWRGKIIGPSETPFEGGIFIVDIACSNGYPFKPPQYRMLTKMYHPNISSNGEISMSILNRDWNPILGIGKVLLSISSILDTPSMEDPINLEAAQCFREDREKYNSLVRQYTSDYAKESVTHDDSTLSIAT
jgi:ubiquitin-conjugating enzyme E2 D/E